MMLLCWSNAQEKPFNLMQPASLRTWSCTADSTHQALWPHRGQLREVTVGLLFFQAFVCVKNLKLVMRKNFLASYNWRLQLKFKYDSNSVQFLYTARVHNNSNLRVRPKEEKKSLNNKFTSDLDSVQLPVQPNHFYNNNNNNTLSYTAHYEAQISKCYLMKPADCIKSSLCYILSSWASTWWQWNKTTRL